MTRLRQFYDAGGVPIAVPGAAAEVADAWRSHRRRLRTWLERLPDDGWSGATRCAGWRVKELAQHLVSGCQFLGYTLHESRKGQATRLLEGFDTQQTPAMAAARFAGLSPRDLLDRLSDADARVDTELDSLAADDWNAVAEGPLGHVPAHVAVNHFLFDSWVHERDLLLPADETPVTEPDEAALVASYVVGLAGVVHAVDGGAPAVGSLQVHLTDIDRHVHVHADEEQTTVSVGPAPDGHPDVSATAGELVDYATGRTTDAHLDADPAASAFLGRLASALG